MNRRTWMIAGGLAAALTVVLVLVWWSRKGDDLEPIEDLADPAILAPEASDEAVEPLDVNLYFPGEGGKLYTESRSLPRLKDPVAEIEALVQALLDGPQSSSLRAPLSDGASLRQAYLVGKVDPGRSSEDAPSADPRSTSLSLAGQTVVLDFATEGALPPRSTGSQREMLMAYSLVNSILLNFEQGRGVIILWNGQQGVTFGGHLDTGRPLAADLSLVARQAPPPYDPKADEEVGFLAAPTTDELSSSTAGGPGVIANTSGETNIAASPEGR